jgi:hypothetical protein
VHCSSTVNIHVRVQKGYHLRQACTKCTYKRHIAIKQEVDVHEAGDKAIENICKVLVYAFICFPRQLLLGQILLLILFALTSLLVSICHLA